MALLSCGYGSDAGCIRDHNEDSYVVDPQLGLWLVADGMGGHQGGEVASAIAGLTIHQAIVQGCTLNEAIQQAHQAILAAGEQGAGVKGMGSTVVALLGNGLDYEIAWVGDSRAYLWDVTDAAFYQLSHDHSYVQWLVDKGELSEEDAPNHPQSHIVLQALGSSDRQRLRVSRISGQWRRGQRILLCSDGLSGELDDNQIGTIMRAGDPEQTQAERLIQAALEHGGRDNVSTIIVSAPAEAPAPVSLEATLPHSDLVPSLVPSSLLGKWLPYVVIGVLCLLLIALALLFI